MSEKWCHPGCMDGDSATQIHQHLANCSIEELQDGLSDLVLGDDDSEETMDLIDAYLAELEARSPCTTNISAEESLRNFHEKYDYLFETEAAQVEAPRPVKHRPIRRYVLLAATIALFVSLLVVQTMGVNWFEALARWTSETFGLVFDTSEVEETDRIDDDLFELRKLLEEHGEKEILLPTYVPDGYVQYEIREELDQNRLSVGYRRGDNYIAIRIIKVDSSSGTIIEKDIDNPEIYTTEKVECYVMGNVGTYTAAWRSGAYECIISGVPTKEDLISILDSIC